MRCYRQMLAETLGEPKTAQLIRGDVDVQATTALFLGAIQGLLMRSMLGGHQNPTNRCLVFYTSTLPAREPNHEPTPALHSQAWPWDLCRDQSGHVRFVSDPATRPMHTRGTAECPLLERAIGSRCQTPRANGISPAFRSWVPGSGHGRQWWRSEGNRTAWLPDENILVATRYSRVGVGLAQDALDVRFVGNIKVC